MKNDLFEKYPIPKAVMTLAIPVRRMCRAKTLPQD